MMVMFPVSWEHFISAALLLMGKLVLLSQSFSRGHVNVFLCSGGVVLCYVGSGESFMNESVGIISFRALQVHWETLKQTLC